MMRATLLLTLLASAPPVWADEAPREARRYELRVVGVYRPVELAGRFVEVPREVYLQAMDGTKTLKSLVGKELTVHREVPVPAAIPMQGTAPATKKPVAEGTPEKPRAKAMKAKKKKKKKKLSARQRLAAKKKKARAAKKAAKKKTAKKTAKGDAEKSEPDKETPPAKIAAQAAGEPPGDKPKAPPNRVASPMRGEAPPVDAVRRVEPAPVPARRIEVEVGRLQVVGVRGDVAVARVVDDAAEGARGADMPVDDKQGPTPDRWVELPAVLVGDLARLVIEPPPPAPPPPLTAEERARLEAERDALDRDVRRRDARRPKYERKVMKWKL